MKAEEPGGSRTTDQMRDEGQRLIKIIQFTMQKHSEQEFSNLALTN